MLDYRTASIGRGTMLLPELKWPEDEKPNKMHAPSLAIEATTEAHDKRKNIALPAVEGA